MTNTEKYSIIISCYAKELSNLEELMNPKHFTYDYLNMKADDAHKAYVQALIEERHDDAKKWGAEECEAREEVRTRTEAYKRIYDLLVEKLGLAHC